MKKLISLVLLAGLGVVASGCSTPAYSSRERANQISRNMQMEWRMMQDDIDSALLLRPVSGLTSWNIAKQ